MANRIKSISGESSAIACAEWFTHFELSKLEISSGSRINKYNISTPRDPSRKQVQNIESGPQGDQIAFLPNGNCSNDIVVMCSDVIDHYLYPTLILKDGINSVLKLQLLDEVGLPEGEKATLPLLLTCLARYILPVLSLWLTTFSKLLELQSYWGIMNKYKYRLVFFVELF